MRGDLTTLASARSWLKTTTQDDVLSRLITSVSADVRSRLGRGSLASEIVSETRRLGPTGRMVLRRYPVTTVISVSVDGTLCVPSPTGSTAQGWVVSPIDADEAGSHQYLDVGSTGLWGWDTRVDVAYRAGYLQGPEVVAVPVGGQYTVLAPRGSWASDAGVAYDLSGLPLVPVPSAPQAGQYCCPAPGPDQQPGVYQFAAADVGSVVAISYSYVPSALEQLVLDVMAERLAYRGRVGVASKSLGGQETIAYDRSGMPAWAAAAMASWVDTVPVPP